MKLTHPRPLPGVVRPTKAPAIIDKTVPVSSTPKFREEVFGRLSGDGAVVYTAFGLESYICSTSAL